MFDTFFYLFCWLMMFMLGLPVIVAGILTTYNTQTIKNPLQQLTQDVSTYKNNKEKLKIHYDDFCKNFRTCPDTKEDYEMWLGLVYEFCVNPLLMEAEAVAKWRDELENDNPNSKNEIRTKIATALQKRDK
ncbi:hypothetical protein [Helicobacter sp. 10-6591]|uniref:hypothetical protein n=1 Tax=Helicobacter sp. 10-6591 TaxID=2004998 RepID=UPI000DCCED5F|nr:hypothetical protein [Helicobacter sp. 10-6591]RAX56046.1 hypothetical protein CCY97_01725 [Helicobacter sp. 10-6591]